MAKIRLSDVSFYYHAPYKSVFEHLNLDIDCSWHIGAVGLNGRGKTTLLRLISGDLQPSSGKIFTDPQVVYFPFAVPDEKCDVRECVKSMVYPFSATWDKIEKLLADGGSGAMEEYVVLEEDFRNAGGYDIDARIEKEISSIGFSPGVLLREFHSLSPGEKTRLMIAALFLRKNAYPLIDEPTNHLDAAGREIVADYLSRRTGFLCVSHDRHFLNLCTNHIVAFEKTGVEIHGHGFKEWDINRKMMQESEVKQNDRLKRTIKKLEDAARQRRGWSFNQEMNKFNGNNDVGNNKGAIGHKAAKMMKQALVIERRKNEEIEEKKGLLLNAEKEYKIKIPVADRTPDVVARADNIGFGYGGRKVLDGINLEVRRRMRVALTGANGAGKSTLLKILLRELMPQTGSVFFPAHLLISVCRQINSWRDGTLADYLNFRGFDSGLFRRILGSLGIKGDLAEKYRDDFSEGERRKIELAGSIMIPANLYIWDEPLNYLDIPARAIIEEAVLEANPTMIFVEHDAVFVENIATDVFNFEPAGDR